MKSALFQFIFCILYCEGCASRFQSLTISDNYLAMRSDMEWSSNTEYIVMMMRAFNKIWMLRRLKALGASQFDLLDVYTKQVRS